MNTLAELRELHTKLESYGRAAGFTVRVYADSMGINAAFIRSFFSHSHLVSWEEVNASDVDGIFASIKRSILAATHSVTPSMRQ